MNLMMTLPNVASWLEKRLGYGFDQITESGITLLANKRVDDSPLLAYKIGAQGIVRTRPEWMDAMRPVVDGLHLDELFSVFGMYELARVTLPDGVRIWGPSLYYFASKKEVRLTDATQVQEMMSGDVGAIVDAEVFWHCNWQDASTCFGILEGNGLIALTTVRHLGDDIYEVDVDVDPKTGRQGLGRAVMSAACSWILEQGGLILARTAHWNIPSARLLRSMGLQYALCDLVGQEGPFLVPPQPLGKPLRDVDVYNKYPIWGMNHDILPKP